MQRKPFRAKNRLVEDMRKTVVNFERMGKQIAAACFEAESSSESSRKICFNNGQNYPIIYSQFFFCIATHFQAAFSPMVTSLAGYYKIA